MNTCIICREQNEFENELICPRCRDAFLYYKEKYFTEKKFNETNEYDEYVFERSCKKMGLNEYLDECMTGLIPDTYDEVIEDILPVLQTIIEENEWMKKLDGRPEAFVEYVKSYIRKYFDEHQKGETVT